MKKTILFAAALITPVFCMAAQDCGKNAEACSAKAPVSPFIAASRQPQPAQVRQSQAATKIAAAPAPKAPAQAQAPVVPVEPAPAQAPVPVKPAEGLSSPAWLLFVAAGVTGLYFYLRGGSRRGRKK